MVRFYSKKDIWLTVLAVGVPLFTLLSVVIAERDLVAVIVFVVINGFTLWCWFFTYYQFEETGLRIVGGPFRWFVPYTAIQSIRKSRNPVSAPALSINRLEIKYRVGNYMLISPKNQEEFVSLLKSKCPQMDIQA